MRYLALLVLVALAACNHHDAPGPVRSSTYVVHANQYGVAQVTAPTAVDGRLLDFHAWQVVRTCPSCDPSAWHLIADVHLLAGGLLLAHTAPGAEVAFIVEHHQEVEP